MILSNKQIIKALIRLREAGLGLCYSQTPEDRFSRVEAHLDLQSHCVAGQTCFTLKSEFRNMR